MSKNNFTKYVFLLSGENLELAKEEVLSIIESKKSKLIGKLLIVEAKEFIDADELSNRLALTKSIHKLLFQCNKKDLIQKIKDYDWDSILVVSPFSLISSQ